LVLFPMFPEPDPSQRPSPIPDGDRNITVGRDVIASILVTGDHNQIFRGDYVNLRDFYIEPWQVLERVDLERYVGRRWLQESLDGFLGSNDRGYFVLEAQAGLGKTTFLAHLVKSRHYIHHFAELAPGIDGSLVGARNLAAQLAVSWKLRDFDTYIPVASLGSEYLQKTLSEAAEVRNKLKPEEKIVILVDALDQVVRMSGQNPLNLPRHLPKGVYFVVSQQPGTAGVSTTTARQVAMIEKDDLRNMEDLKEYLTDAFAKPRLAQKISETGADLSRLVEVLVEKSRGVWVYAHFVVTDLESGLRSATRLDELPPGLWRYYADFFAGWKVRNPQEWDAFGRKLLASLAVCQEEIPLASLCQMVGISLVDEAKSLLQNAWASIVILKPKRQAEFSFYHASTRDFALGEFARPEEFTHAERVFAEVLASDCLVSHACICDYFLRLWGGIDQSLPSLAPKRLPQEQRYGAKHLPVHLSHAGRVEELHRLLAVERGGKPLWYELESAQDDLFQYFAHLDAAQQLAQEQALSPEPLEGLALVVRYSLTLSSLNSIATNLPPALLRGLLETKLWSVARARSYAERCREGSPRASALRQLLGFLDGAAHETCISKILENVGRVDGSPSGHFEGLLLQELLDNHHAALTDGDLERVFQTIVELVDPDSKLRTMACLADRPLSESLAARVSQYAKDFWLTGTDSLQSEIEANRAEIRTLQIVLRIARQLTGAARRKEIARIVRDLLVLDKPGPWRMAITELGEDPDYDAIARGEGLPLFADLVERGMELFIEHSYITSTFVAEMLPYLGANKLSAFDQYVMPDLSVMGNVDLADKVEKMANANPELLPRLVQVTEQGRRSAIKGLCAARLVPFLEQPSAVIDAVLGAFEEHPDEPLIGESMGYLGKSMSPDQLERATGIVRRLSDPAAMAAGLAHLGVSSGRDDLVQQAIRLLREIREIRYENKVNQIAATLNASSNVNWMQSELATLQELRDHSSVVASLCPLLAWLTAAEKAEALGLVESLLPEITDDYERAQTLSAFLSEISGNLPADSAQRFFELLRAISSRGYSESKISGIFALAAHSNVFPFHQLLEEALQVTSIQPSKGLELKLRCLVAASSGGKLQNQLVEQIAEEFAQLTNADQRYALLRFAPLLEGERRDSVVDQVIRNTPSDKYYTLCDLCPILPTRTARWLTRQIDDGTTGYHQVLPDLAQRLAVLGELELALEATEMLKAYERLKALIGVAPELDLARMERAEELLDSAVVDEQVPAQRELRDQARAELWIRKIQLRDLVEPAFAPFEEIENSGVKCMAKLRIAPYLDRSTREVFFSDARAELRNEGRPHKRAAIRDHLLSLPLELFPFEERLRLFLLCVELAAHGSRSNTLAEMRAFAGTLLERWGTQVASAWFREIVRVRGWWN
jgi:hypothetical protein